MYNFSSIKSNWAISLRLATALDSFDIGELSLSISKLSQSIPLSEERSSLSIGIITGAPLSTDILSISVSDKNGHSFESKMSFPSSMSLSSSSSSSFPKIIWVLFPFFFRTIFKINVVTYTNPSSGFSKKMIYFSFTVRS